MVTRDEIDRLWQKAMHQSIADGEQFTRYHFSNLIASHVAEECANVCENRKIDGLLVHSNAVMNCASAIRSLYKPTA